MKLWRVIGPGRTASHEVTHMLLVTVQFLVHHYVRQTLNAWPAYHIQSFIVRGRWFQVSQCCSNFQPSYSTWSWLWHSAKQIQGDFAADIKKAERCYVDDFIKCFLYLFLKNGETKDQIDGLQSDIEKLIKTKCRDKKNLWWKGGRRF